MGESGEGELRKTPEGKLRREEYEKKGNGRKRIKMGEKGERHEGGTVSFGG